MKCPVLTTHCTHQPWLDPDSLPADVRNRVSVPFRQEVPADAAPLLGIRASPAGRHLLLIFRCAEPGGARKGSLCLLALHLPLTPI